MVLYTFVSVGVMVNQHNCCHGITALEINGVDIYDDNCCQDSTVTCDDSGCCSDEAVYLALEDEHQWNNISIDVVLLSRWVSNTNTPEVNEMLLEEANINQDSPRGPPLFLLHSSFVFYG